MTPAVPPAGPYGPLTRLLGRAADVVATLVADGTRATLDRRDVNPPAVYLAPAPQVAFVGYAGTVEATYTGWAVASDLGDVDATAQLLTLLDAVDAAVDGLLDRADPDTVALPGVTDAAPAYRFTFTDKI